MKHNQRPRRRTASITHEAALALVLAIGLLTGLAQVLAITAQQKRIAAQRSQALVEAGNLMERLMARPYASLTAESVTQVGLTEEARRAIPDPQLTVELREEMEPVPAKRIGVRIDWRNASGTRSRPVSLVAWKYNQEKQP